MNYLASAAIGAVLLGTAGMSQAATVDFNNIAAGTTVGSNTNLGGGIIADIVAGGAGNDGAVILDTTPGSVGSGNDGDLTSPFSDAEGNLASRSFGNSLIVQEDQSNQNNPTTGPDDLGSGGTLSLSFQSDVTVTSLFLLDVQEGSSATLLLDGSVVASFDVDANNESDTGNNPNNNQFTFFDFDGLVGDELFVSFSASGAIGEFEVASVAAVPVPASLPLLVGGFGMMAYMRRRRKTS